MTVLLLSCDPMDENAQPVDQELSAVKGSSTATDEAARKYPDVTLKRGMMVYSLSELAYRTLADEETIRKAILHIRKSGGRDADYFIREMMDMSMSAFDEAVMRQGGFLTKEAQTAFRQHYSGDYFFDLDPSDDPLEAYDVFLKIPDLPGDREGFPIFSELSRGNIPGHAAPHDTLQNIQKKHLATLIDFLDVAPRYLRAPEAMNQALLELEISSGLNQTAIALLLPAVQKVREAAFNPQFKGGVHVAAGDITGDGQYGRGLHENLLKIGGVGALEKLMDRSFDSSGDLDWSLLQLHRRKFEFEMWLLWDTFWKENSGEQSVR